MKNKIKSVVLIGIGFGLGFAMGKDYMMTQLKRIFEDDAEAVMESRKRHYDRYSADINKSIIPKTDDIVFASRADAQEVLTTFAHVIDNYGQATVADLLELIGIVEPTATDYKYGWRNANLASIVRRRIGYVLNLPEPILLSYEERK
jgi:hypothetical protein